MTSLDTWLALQVDIEEEKNYEEDPDELHDRMKEDE